MIINVGLVDRIGFMQGRLSPLVDGKIRAFPFQDWKEEFQVAASLGLNLMEWTLDQNRLYENPLMTNFGRQRIRSLCLKYGLAIPSLTGDCFMQAPFWKADKVSVNLLYRDFIEVIKASSIAGIALIVIPLVDNGRIETRSQEDCLVQFL